MARLIHPLLMLIARATEKDLVLLSLWRDAIEMQNCRVAGR